MKENRFLDKLQIIFSTITADNCFLVYERKGKIDSITVGDVSEFAMVISEEGDK